LLHAIPQKIIKKLLILILKRSEKVQKDETLEFEHCILLEIAIFAGAFKRAFRRINFIDGTILTYKKPNKDTFLPEKATSLIFSKPSIQKILTM